MPISVFMNNSGGLNVTDSPLAMSEDQATGQSYNYDYARTGAITKVLGTAALNTSPDTQLKSLGLGMYHNATTDARSLIRAAGTSLQLFDLDSTIATDLSSDTASPTTSFLDVNSTQPVVYCPFNTLIGGTQLWMAGGDMTAIQGYTGTNITANGTPTPTGAVTASVTNTDGGSFVANGTYYYAVQFRKLGTQAFSNVALDVSAAVTASTDSVTLTLTGITNNDATRYDQIWIYRSVVSGVTAFTTGSLIAKVVSSATSYKDLGTTIASAQNIARAGNTLLDNSPLESGTYKSVTAFKRRLVTAKNSTLYISDLDKPESWPATNVITLPSGGPITAVGTIGVPSEYTTGADQYLCIWKERELWVLTGDNYTDWELFFVDKTGCLGQSLVVAFNGFISWLTFNGIYLWDGRGKPSRVSRPIQALFEADGDLDKNHLSQGYSTQYEKGNQVIWRVSHRTKGVNKISIKMDTRLTAKSVASNLENSEMDGVFILDTDSNAYYSLCSYRPSTEEILIAGDDTGYVYQMFNSSATAIAFDYETKHLDMGAPQILKNFKRVLVYVEKLTPNDLELFFWADYRIRSEYQSVVRTSLAPQKGAQPALWDVALWDQASWDDYSPDISPVEFNLHSNENNSTGISLKLRFEQLEANAPVRIHGFAVEWEPANNLPIPTQQIG